MYKYGSVFAVICYLMAVTGCDNSEKKSNSNKVAKKARIVFERTSHDFGSLKEGDDAQFTFKFKNISNTPLILYNVQTGCGCTVVNWSKEPIRKNQKDSLIVRFDSKGKIGQQLKYVTIFSNSEKEVEFLTFKGQVEKR
jgi:hypothetical protein